MLVVEADRTRLPLLRVDRPSRVLPLDLLRADSRARVAMGTDLRTGARFELTLLDRRTVSFSLHFSADATRGSRALVGSGGTRGRAAASTTRTALWLLPSLWQIWTDPLDEVQDWARAKLVTFGLSTSMLVLLMTVWVPIAAGGWFAWGQRTAVVDAKASAEAALGSASAANAGRDAALEAEATCMSQRTDLARALGDTLAEREARVDAALEASAARAFALELGGARLATPELARVEEDSLGRIRERLVKELGDSPPLPEEALRCTAANAALEKDLPAWVLLWHPDARVVCPLDFDSEAGGVHQRGSWGLSDRILRQFGPPSAEGDARLVDRLAANMFTKGLRAVRAAILAAPTGERPPVAPAELHLWTVTLWDAYNRMPSRPRRCSMSRRPPACRRSSPRSRTPRTPPPRVCPSCTTSSILRKTAPFSPLRPRLAAVGRRMGCPKARAQR
jgi:hypothetical protein